MTESPKVWKAGIADEVWKVLICARDAEMAKDVIQKLANILGDPGNGDLNAHADVIRRFTGDQIADALLGYREKCAQSVVNGLRKNEAREGGA